MVLKGSIAYGIEGLKRSINQRKNDQFILVLALPINVHIYFSEVRFAIFAEMPPIEMCQCAKIAIAIV